MTSMMHSLVPLLFWPYTATRNIISDCYNTAMDTKGSDNTKDLLNEVLAAADVLAEIVPDLVVHEEEVAKDMDELLEEAGQTLEKLAE